MSRSGRAFKGAITGGIQYGLQLASQTFIVPFALATAGQETLGAYGALIQFVGYLGFIDFGFGSAASWYLATAFGQADGGARFRELLFDIRTMLFAINGVSSLLLLAAATHVKEILSLSGPIARQAELSLFAMAAWAFVKTPIVVYSMCLRPTQQLMAANSWGMVGNILRLVSLIAMLKLGAGIFALVVATLLGDIASNAGQAMLFKHRFPELIPKHASGGGHIREMFGFGIYALLANSGSYLISGTDVLVVNKLFGSISAAIYYSSYVPAQVLWQMMFRLPSNAAPAMSEMHGLGETGSIRGSYLRLLRYGFLLSIPLSLILWVVHRELVHIWVGNANYAGKAMTLSLALIVFVSAPNAICGTVLTCIGRVRTISFWVMSEGITNLGLSLFLARRFGLQGVAVGTAISAMLHFPIYLAVTTQAVGSNLDQLWNHLRPLVIPTISTFVVAAAAPMFVKGPATALVLGSLVFATWLAAAGGLSTTKAERMAVSLALDRAAGGLGLRTKDVVAEKRAC
jgi:O-antigen/teichoic acid export membrane protein